MNHTPGPWAANRFKHGAPLVEGGGHEIARVAYWSGSENASEVDANAHLIAAAPDLLAALHRSKTIFEEISFLEDPRLACREGVSIIEAAIAKATSPQAR